MLYPVELRVHVLQAVVAERPDALQHSRQARRNFQILQDSISFTRDSASHSVTARSERVFDDFQQRALRAVSFRQDSSDKRFRFERVSNSRHC